MIILGLDPGTAITGYAFINVEGSQIQLLECGCIRTPAHTPMPARLATIRADLQCLLTKYSPTVAAVEILFFEKNTKTAITVAQARGVLLETLFEQNVTILELTPLQVKMGITGYGKADKRQIQEMTRTILGLTDIPKPDDAADAIAMAITAINRYTLEKSLIEKARG